MESGIFLKTKHKMGVYFGVPWDAPQEYSLSVLFMIKNNWRTNENTNTIVMEHYNIVVLKHCQCCVHKEELRPEVKSCANLKGDVDNNVQDMCWHTYLQVGTFTINMVDSAWTYCVATVDMKIVVTWKFLEKLRCNGFFWSCMVPNPLWRLIQQVNMALPREDLS